ncbi:hypothetical protein FA375_06755 [Pseudomonas aeruginosa]|nr:hypothetical protein [Pseudomonas aeruginosa]MCO2256149.1 hypothetical protein [Pseudomonas aeruginosa]MCO3076377.1 hypothetical protein [Pseudomonas aeruginosa]HBO5846995.1 hypothetical protein [Pseudomonas aeruginosa]HBO5913270.1 hypothetical protein [Pseudomonas aeruginosa]
MRKLLLVCCFFAVAGCTMFTREPDFPWSKDELPCFTDGKTIRNCDRGDVLKAYALARIYCHQLSENYEDGGDFVNSSTFAIAGVGTLAGAVFSPLASGGAKTAWSGVSGSANALQTALNTSFSNAVNARRRAEIGNAGAAAREQVAKESDSTIQVLAAMDMAYDCKMAVGRADIAVIQALDQIQMGAGRPKESSAASVRPEETQIEAGKKAEEAARNAVNSVEVPAAAMLNSTEQTVVKGLRQKINDAAIAAASAVAASTATEAVQKVATTDGEAPSLIQIQAAARIAAEIAAEAAAKVAADDKAAQLLSGQPTKISAVVRESTASAASAAAQAAAEAAASAAAAPVQPVRAQ